MATAVQCQHCGQRYAVREDLLGKRMKCKACGQPTAIVAAPAAPKPAPANSKTTAAKPAAVAPPAAPKAATASKQPAPRRAAAPAATKAAGAAGAAAQRAPSTAGRGSAAPPAASAGSPSGTAPTHDPLFAPQSNLLDLLGDSALPAATASPLGSGVVLKPIAAPPAAKPKAKKKKKKRSGESSDNAKVLMRMTGGALVVLLGLGIIGWGVSIIINDESGAKGFRAIRRFVLGVGVIGSGIKMIVG